MPPKASYTDPPKSGPNRDPNPIDIMNKALAISLIPDFSSGSFITGAKNSEIYGIEGNILNAYAHPTQINPITTGAILFPVPQNGASIIFPQKQIINERDIKNVF